MTDMKICNIGADERLNKHSSRSGVEVVHSFSIHLDICAGGPVGVTEIVTGTYLPLSSLARGCCLGKGVRLRRSKKTG